MKRSSYIVLLIAILSICFNTYTVFLSQKTTDKLTQETPITHSCSLQQADYIHIIGLQGNQVITPTGWSISTPTPTHFSNSYGGNSFSKSRSRTAFLRNMLHHCQPQYILFRGQVRQEMSPYACTPVIQYYVYGLRRILC